MYVVMGNGVHVDVEMWSLSIAANQGRSDELEMDAMMQASETHRIRQELMAMGSALGIDSPAVVQSTAALDW